MTLFQAFRNMRIVFNCTRKLNNKKNNINGIVLTARNQPTYYSRMSFDITMDNILVKLPAPVRGRADSFPPLLPREWRQEEPWQHHSVLRTNNHTQVYQHKFFTSTFMWACTLIETSAKGHDWVLSLSHMADKSLIRPARPYLTITLKTTHDDG